MTCPHFIPVFQDPAFHAELHAMETLAQVNFHRFPALHHVLQVMKELAQRYDALHTEFHVKDSEHSYAEKAIGELMSIINEMPNGEKTLKIWRRQKLHDALESMGAPILAVLPATEA